MQRIHLKVMFDLIEMKHSLIDIKTSWADKQPFFPSSTYCILGSRMCEVWFVFIFVRSMQSFCLQIMCREMGSGKSFRKWSKPRTFGSLIGSRCSVTLSKFSVVVVYSSSLLCWLRCWLSANAAKELCSYCRISTYIVRISRQTNISVIGTKT